MIDYPSYVKIKLSAIINEIAASPEPFLKNPGRDFTRNRKITFESVIKMLLSMGGNSIYKELLEYFGFNSNIASTSAFVQQRNKILPSAFEFLFNKFTNSFECYKTYNGYRLFAVDGSDLNIAHNPNDPDTYFQSAPDIKGFNLLHLNAMYDLCNRLYVDACVQPGKKKNEFRALTDMVDHLKIDGNVIVIADRGYESYNVFAHIEQKGWKYVIRVKDINSNGIISGLNLPETDEFDKEINLTLTRKQAKEIKAHPELYKFLPKKSTFDYVDLNNDKFYSMSFRVVRFKISENTYETIITNLDGSNFPAEELKKLYHMRWGIETSFRELKYSIGLTNFHAKKEAYITQEVFARLVMYNFCEIITSHVIIKQKPTKYGYQANFTVAIHVCKHFVRCLNNAPPPDVEALIEKNVLPIREGRQAPRKIKHKTVVSFNYRVA
jgi:hypothetical protein